MNNLATARAFWRKAEEDLGAGEKLCPGYPNVVASRAYYAAFHAVTALLALRGASYTKHEAIRTAVHRDLVRTGEWPAEYGNHYDGLMALRHVGDYGTDVPVSEDDAVKALSAARVLVEAVRIAAPEVFAEAEPQIP